MGSMIRRDDEIRMHGHVRFAVDMRTENAFVEGILRKIYDRVPDLSDDGWDNDLVIVFLRLDLWLVCQTLGSIDTLDGRQKLANGLDLIQSIRRKHAASGILDRRLQFD